MNSKNITVLIILMFSVYLIFLKPIEKISTKRLEKGASLENSIIKSNKSKKQSEKVDDILLYTAQLIAPPSDIELKDTWKDEYTCMNTKNCNRFIFNARSYEDALWLKRKGYPSRSNVESLQDISIKDLWELSENENIRAKNLIALNALKHKDIKSARNYAMASIAYKPRETFAYRVMAESLLLEKDPMMATYYLRMAIILGDTNATARYEEITASSSSALIDNTNQLSYNNLLNQLNTDISNLNNDPRPIGGS